MTLVYLDANVLVPSYTRTLLVMAAPLSDFTAVWSLHAETAAERPHLRTSRTTLSNAETAGMTEAIGYAARRRAQRILLFAWSTGTSIALRFADHPRRTTTTAAPPH